VLRVMSYNVQGLKGDRAALVEVVREAAPDVLVAQEAPRRLRWRTRNAQLAHDVDLVYVCGGAPSLGNVILSDLAVRPYTTWELRYPLIPGRQMRGAAFARCTAEGAAFVLVGSHLAADADERPGQAELLEKALTEADAPVIFAGTLNETSGGAAWRTLADGLVDAAGTDDTVTYPLTGHRLDVIFVDPRITVTSYRVIDTPTARRASDHLPVVVELTLPSS
jgi:endonuclease/exonuclease/phosphatase family metal-dependent hydrolase